MIDGVGTVGTRVGFALAFSSASGAMIAQNAMNDASAQGGFGATLGDALHAADAVSFPSADMAIRVVVAVKVGPAVPKKKRRGGASKMAETEVQRLKRVQKDAGTRAKVETAKNAFLVKKATASKEAEDKVQKETEADSSKAAATKARLDDAEATADKLKSDKVVADQIAKDKAKAEKEEAAALNAITTGEKLATAKAKAAETVALRAAAASKAQELKDKATEARQRLGDDLKKASDAKAEEREAGMEAFKSKAKIEAQQRRAKRRS